MGIGQTDGSNIGCAEWILRHQKYWGNISAKPSEFVKFNLSVSKICIYTSERASCVKRGLIDQIK